MASSHALIQIDMKIIKEETRYCDETDSNNDPLTSKNCSFTQQNQKDMINDILESHSKDKYTFTMTDDIKQNSVEEHGTVSIQNICDLNYDMNINKSAVGSRYGLRQRQSTSPADNIFIKSIKNKLNCEEMEVITKNNNLKCLKCSETFNDVSSLESHEQNSVSCSFCNSTFCSIDSCNDHIVTCVEGKKENGFYLNCIKCSKTFRNSSELLSHACSNNKVTFKCDKCNRIFNDVNELNLHVLEKQCRNMKVFTCDTCKKTFTDFSELKSHIAGHLTDPLQCLSCRLFFESHTLLSQHNCGSVAINNSDALSTEKLHNCKNSRFICQQCNKEFSSQEHFEDHKISCVSLPKTRSNELVQRKIPYKNVENIKNSRKRCVTEKVYIKCKKLDSSTKKCKYECHSCGKKFSRLPLLQIHILYVHHGISYSCDKCNIKFASQEELDVHLTKACVTEEPCFCKTCGKIFAKKTYLKKHEYIHSNALHRCKFCHCAFMKEKSYLKHIEGMNCSKSARKIRLSEFNYKKCRICNVTFEDEKLLIEHFTTNHPNENPHQCFCCDSCLPTFKDLQNHIHLHNIQKYTCNLCGKPYTSQEGFRKHRLKHKEVDFKCQFCESGFLNERRLKFHVKNCKKNPESTYHNLGEKPKLNRKDGKPKQSRQLHWESRIIMKRLRVDPNSTGTKFPGQTNGQENPINCNFFAETDEESDDSNVRGWFDDYYKTEEDDFAFGLKKEKQDEMTGSVPNGSANQKEKSQLFTEVDATPEMHTNDGNDNRDLGSNLGLSSNDTSDSSSEEELMDDIDLHLNYNPKKCRLCLLAFSQEYELLHHFIKLHPNKKAHKCPNCEVEYPLFAQLKEHMKAHGIGMGIYNCDNCSKKFKSEKKMKNHNIRCKGINTENIPSVNRNKSSAHSKVDGEDYCKWCNKQFQTKCGYKRHKQVCKEKRKCNKENKKTEESTCFRDTSEALLHDDCPSPEKHCEEQDMPAQPEINVKKDNSVDVSENSDDRRKEVYLGEPPVDSFPCRLCEKKFQYERGIVMHFKADHPGQKPLVCHICNMHLADKLKEHLKTHGIGEEFICELCGKRFNQKFLSKIHEMWHQGVEYKCNNCKQKFLNQEKMDKHIKENRCSNRQSLMRLPCDICGKSYKSKFGLSKHYITHTPKELRPVKNRMNCEFCGKWFESNNGLERHRRIHTGERPFCCRFCSKAFVQEGNCKSHERIHTGEQRPRKRKSEPTSYSSDYNSLNPCLFNGFNPGLGEQTGLK